MKPPKPTTLLTGSIVGALLLLSIAPRSDAIQATCVRCGPQNTCENVDISWAAKCHIIGPWCATQGTCTIEFIISP